jgi:hypothetical protein
MTIINSEVIPDANTKQAPNKRVLIPFPAYTYTESEVSSEVGSYTSSSTVQMSDKFLVSERVSCIPPALDPLLPRNREDNMMSRSQERECFHGGKHSDELSVPMEIC